MKAGCGIDLHFYREKEGRDLDHSLGTLIPPICQIYKHEINSMSPIAKSLMHTYKETYMFIDYGIIYNYEKL